MEQFEKAGYYKNEKGQWRNLLGEEPHEKMIKLLNNPKKYNWNAEDDNYKKSKRNTIMQISLILAERRQKDTKWYKDLINKNKQQKLKL